MNEKTEIEFNLEKFNRDILMAVGHAKGLREAGDKAGVSASTLSRMANGMTPDIQTFMRICNHLNLAPGDYFECVVWVKRTTGA